MNLKLLNQKIIAFFQNPILKSKDFDKFSKLLMDKELVLNIKSMILRHYKNLEEYMGQKNETWELKNEIGNKEIRKFMSVFIFIYFPEIHRLETGGATNNEGVNTNYQENKLARDLHHLSIQLKFQLFSLCLYIQKTLSTVDDIGQDEKYELGYIPVVKAFFKKLDNFLELFDRWKRYDLENLIFKMAYDFYKFEKKLQDTVDLIPETISVIKQEKKKITHYVKKLDKENGYQKFIEYIMMVEEYDSIDDAFARELFLQRISNLMECNSMIETWDKLELELEENKYEMLEILLVTLKDNIKNCVPARKSFHLELDEILDEKFICSQLQDEVFQMKSLESLVYYLIEKLQELQSQRDDDSTLLFKQEMEDLLEFEPENLPFIIRFFLENINLKFDNIRRQIDFINQKYKEQSN